MADASLVNKFAKAQSTIYKLTAEILASGAHDNCNEVCYSPAVRPAKRVS